MQSLTKTETKVAHLTAQGFIKKEIADKLHVSDHTVHAHLRNIRTKWHAGNIADITRMYILSLDNPKLVLRALFFLVLQLGMIYSNSTNDLRKPPQVRMGKVRTAKKSNRKDFDYAW